MNMLPEPTLTFTLPSIHDSTTLDCRIYHPQSLTTSPRAPSWHRDAAIVAHPYAPLGGSCDDPVVDNVAGTLLRGGFLVATFNFRGAGSSAGHTSWTAKAEKSDYMSLVGFVSYYVHYLDPFRRSDSGPKSPGLPGAAAPPMHDEPPPPRLILAGYSYGAMITSQLPPLDAVLAPFAAPAAASAAADIRLRAQHLAEQQNVIIGSARAALAERHGGVSPRKSLALRIGGDEDRRRSHESHRSFSLDAEDKLRKGVADLMARTKSHKKHAAGHHPAPSATGGAAPAAAAGEQQHALDKLEDLTRPQVAYLLVSPPVGWATNLMTLKIPHPFGKKSWRSSSAKEASPRTDDKTSNIHDNQLAEQKLVEHPCLTVYGDSDSFVAVKRFREWTARLQAVPGSQFRAHEISTAGHFYVEEGVMQRLRDAVRAFAESLLKGEPK